VCVVHFETQGGWAGEEGRGKKDKTAVDVGGTGRRRAGAGMARQPRLVSVRFRVSSYRG
jgi:hypothetical protein